MEKITKLQSANSIVQSFAGAGNGVRPTQELLDFKIPNTGDVYDLSSSYISIDIGITHNTAAIGGFNGAHKIALGMLTDTAGFLENSHAGGNSLLIKNLQFYSQNRGMIESVRRVDTLNLAKRYYELDDIELQRDLDLLGILPQKRGTDVYTTYYVDENRIIQDVGDTGQGVNSINVSKLQNKEHRIYLKDILGIGQAPLFSSSKYGECDLHLELNLDKLRTELMSGNEGNNHSGVAFHAMANQNVGAGVAAFFFETTADYRNAEQELPFFVGQHVKVSGTSSQSANPTNVATVIKEIGKPNATGKCQIAVSTTILVGHANGNDNLTGVTIVPYKTADVVTTINIKSSEMTLVAVKNPKNVPDEIDYITYSTEEIDGGNTHTTNHKRAKIEPNCQTLYIAHCSNNNISPDREINSYRMAIDNVDVSGNREIKKDSAIQRDRVMRAYRNKNVALKNLDQRLSRNSRVEATSRNDQLAVIVEPMELTNVEKTMQLKLVTAANAQEIILFKELVKTI